jgi:GNAT superfamily N-acetyltransferase
MRVAFGVVALWYVVSMSLPTELEFEPVTVRLRDGSAVTVRAIRADDRDKLQTAIRRLSTESRYSRFFSALRELPPQLLDHATNPDAKRELQLVAIAGSEAEEEIIGGTRYAATATDGDCEFGVAVVDEWHGRGLARLLLETLMRAARARGFARMEGYILAGNVAMLGLAKRLGFATIKSPEGPTVCLVRRDLGSVA